MKWLAASLIVLACSAGCHAPKPSFNVLAPYGSSRVPPPATNSTARHQPYYSQPSGVPAGSPPAQPKATSGESGTTPLTSSSDPSLTTSSDVWRSMAVRGAGSQNSSEGSASTGVQLASFEESTSGSSGTAPELFVPDAGSSPIGSLPPPPGASSGNTVVASAKASDSPQPAANTGLQGKPTLQWKTP